MDGLPLLLDAAGRRPPEDVGGVPSHAEYLDPMDDPDRPEHESMRIWGSGVSIQTLSIARRSMTPSMPLRKVGAALYHEAIEIGVKHKSEVSQCFACHRLMCLLIESVPWV